MTEATKILDSEPWYPPKAVQIEGGNLIYTPELNGAKPARHRRGLLEGFVRLADEPDETIRFYASRWGALQLCGCMFPATHNPIRAWNRLSHTIRHCAPLGCYEGRRDDGLWWEPLADWRKWSKQAASILRIVSCLKSGELPKAADWRTIYSQAHRPAPWWRRSIEGERSKIAEVIGEWLELGDVRPVVRWEDWQSKPATIRMAQPGLFPAIAYQLAMSLSSRWVMAICDSCGFGYFPSRAPRPGSSRYCDDCRDHKAPQAAALSAFRERKRRARSLFDQGLSPREIARQVGAREATVSGWVRAWSAGS